MKVFRPILSVLLALCLVLPMAPAYAAEASREGAEVRGIHNTITIDDDAAGGYEGDYVVIYNPATSSSTSYSTGTMTGLIETSVNANVHSGDLQRAEDERPSCIIDVDGIINEQNRREDPNYGVIREGEPTRATSYKVGDTRNFTISSYNPGSGSSLNFKVLAVGAHCYIWTPSQNVTNYYTLDSIDSSYAQQAADEFDRMYSLMNTSFGNHSNGSNGDGKVSLLFYNIDDGWNGSGGFVAGYFSSASYSYDGMPIINIDTYPGVYYKTSSGNEGKSMDIAYGTACHEYQHCINYSNTSGMSTWLNECFSAAAEEICYPGSSVVSRIQSWENYYFSDNGDWDNPPSEVAYTSAYTLHKGFSMYNWNNNLEMDDTLALYAQVSFFAQYLFTRFGNGIYKQISNKFSSSEPTAITNATGVNCADLVRDFRVAVTANAAQDQYNGIYGFKAQAGYDPDAYHGVENPWSLLSPVVFTGSSCSIKGGGAITVKPVGGVYNPPSGASSSLKYIGIRLAAPYTVTAESNNTAWGTVEVNGTTILCTPAAGYYVESCDVISGTASCTINGNTVDVAPDSDCTVRVNFAPKPTYTVNFVVAGGAAGTQTALVNDVITLPGSVDVNPEGWTFSGWTAAPIDGETVDKPVFYAPGAAYTVTGNATLHALYTRVEEGTGEIVFQLAEGLEDGGQYLLVAENSISGMTGYAVGNTVVTSNHYLSAVAVTRNSDNTCTTADLSSVLWVASGSESNGYTFYNEAVGKYMGLDSSEYLAPTASAVAWFYTANRYLDNRVDSEGYYYLSYAADNGRYTTSKSGNIINLYRAVNGSTTYYTTEPVIEITLQITQQPEDYTGAVGATASFTVEAIGDGLTYRWQYKSLKDGKWYNANVTGAADATMRIEVTAARNGMQFRCKVTDSSGETLISEPATLRADVPALAITGQPEDYTGAVGDTASFTVEAQGDGLTYQWQYKSLKDGKWYNTKTDGYNTPTMRIEVTAARNGMQFRCKVTDSSGKTVISSPATLYAGAPLSITAQPEDYTGAVGDIASFTVEAQGDGLSYRWQYKSLRDGKWYNANVTGATAATMSIEVTAARSGMQFRCKVTDSSGKTVTSAPATLYVAG